LLEARILVLAVEVLILSQASYVIFGTGIRQYYRFLLAGIAGVGFGYFWSYTGLPAINLFGSHPFPDIIFVLAFSYLLKG